MLQRAFLTMTVGAILTGVLGAQARANQYDVDGFIDEMIVNANSYDIGERTAFTPPVPQQPPIGPAAAIAGPINAATIRGQFEFTCSTGSTPADCPDAAYAAANFNWKWGALKVDGGGGMNFADVAGATFFPSALANEGFTTVETQGFEGNPFTRLAHIEFRIEDAGLTLDPGFSYIFFALLAPNNVIYGNQVPNQGAGAVNQAEESVYFSSVQDYPPFQFHQAFPSFDTSGQTNQLVAGRIIPITPEPTTAALILLGLGSLAVGRRKTGR